MAHGVKREALGRGIGAGGCIPRGRPRRLTGRAFSLAEMMIALVILGFGLLVIGAALPVGFKYSKANVDRATGDAAVEHALDTIEQSIRLSRDPWDEVYSVKRYADIFQPRDALTGELAVDPVDSTKPYEPRIKVRPLLAMSIDAEPGSPNYGQQGSFQTRVEQHIANWLNPLCTSQECDANSWVLPALPSVSAVYPPINADAPFTAQNYLGAPYDRRGVTDAERLRAIDRRVVWTAFYRRVSYEEGSDPNLYEVIAVAIRLSSAGQRHPLFNIGSFADATLQRADDAGSKGAGWPGTGGSTSPGSPGADPYSLTSQVVSTGRNRSDAFLPSRGGGEPVNTRAGGGQRSTGDEPRALSSYGFEDTLAPVPWLVTFVGWDPQLQVGVHYANTSGRELSPTFVDPPTFSFIATWTNAGLMPPGSVLIPAVNDDAPSGTGGVRWAGFVPHAPNTLPIYEVERVEPRSDGNYDVIVKSNGFYPWTSTGNPSLWPVWVIPPAFEETDSSGNPVYEKRSPIVAIGRRFIRFHEVP